MAKGEESKNVGAFKINAKKERKNLESLEWYKARFKQAELKDGQRGEYVRFSFEVLNGVCDDGTTAKGQLVSALATYDTSIGSKFYDLLSGILGREPKQDEECDLKPFYGETYEVNVEVEKKKGATEAYTNIKKIRIPKAKEGDKKKVKVAKTPPAAKKSDKTKVATTSTPTGKKKLKK